ncbi:MAG: hypothetical protein MI725_16765 [Pirellulales bacterium]|nr:hypothetical protein [Pirellulales bacterium]
MKKNYLVLAVATLMIGASGCGSSRWFKTQTVARPVYPQCAPLCAPSCNPGCNPCGTTGGEVTYGFSGSPETTYLPATSGETLPVMVPAGSGSYQQ